MAITYVATGTAATTFTELPARRLTNKFGDIQVLTAVFRGLERNYNAWAPSLGSNPAGILANPQGVSFSNFFLVQKDRSDAEGGLVDVTLIYVGGESVATSGSGVIYSNLKVGVELLSKSFSWQGAAKIGSSTATLVNLSASFQYGTLEAQFTYTAFSYTNGGQFRSQAVNLVGIPTGPFFYYTESILVLATGLTSYIVVPTIINPQLVLSRFTAKQNSTTSFLNKFPSVITQPSIWDVQEVWSLEYNMGSLGVPTATYAVS
jgi:hypothetical protein